jgi:hypothetical protein
MPKAGDANVIDRGSLRHELPRLPFDFRAPLRIAVVLLDDVQSSAHATLEELRGHLPAGSWIRSFRGSVNRCRVEGWGNSWKDAADVESWFRNNKPDLLLYPRIEDIEFGLQPLGWCQCLRISLPRVVVNVVATPSTVRERLLVREMMMSVGDFWPREADDCLSPVLPGLPEGLSWIVRGSRVATDLLQLKPQRAVRPRIEIIQDEFDDRRRLMVQSGLAKLLLRDAPISTNAH